MPARKPRALSNGHTTKKEKSARDAAENAATPTTELTIKPPAELAGHKTAGEVWKRLISLYLETEGKIITAFDADVLVKYCLAEEELVEVKTLRGDIMKLWGIQIKILSKFKPTEETIEAYSKALAQANKLMQRFQGMDARLDGKRKMVFAMAQSLYLTPRSRAGVAPPEKEPEKPLDEMEKLLDQ